MTKYTKIATHVNVDLDAVIGACCELIRHNLEPTEENLVFVPADTTKVSKGTLAVDIQARKHGRGKSYVGYYCRNLLPYQLCEEIDEQDSTGRSSSTFPLYFIITALRKTGMSDFEIVKHMYPIVHGLIQIRIEWDSMEAIVESMPKIQIGDYKFLVSMDVDSRGLSGTGAKAGLDGSIFWGEDGCGITSYDRNNLNLAHLELDEWFTHSAGFVFAYGTRKAPKKVPPPQFKTVEEFIEYLKCQEVFYIGEE